MKLKLKRVKPKKRDEDRGSSVKLERKVKADDSDLMNAMAAFDHRKIACLVPYDVVGSGRRTRVLYDVTALVPLGAYLNTEVDSEQFIVLVESLLRTFAQVDELHIAYDRLALERKYVYVNPVEGTMALIFVGQLVQNREEYPAFDVFKSLGEVTRPRSYEDRQLMDGYLAGLNEVMTQSVMGYRVFAQAFVDRYRGTVHETSGVRRTTLNMVSGAAFYDARQAAHSRQAQGMPSDGLTGDLRSVAGDLRGAQEGGRAPAVRVTWDETGAVWNVNGFPFLLGSGKGVPGCIEGNNWVSRQHARLVFDGGRVMLEDLNSTNGTFLNGHTVLAGSRVPVGDGDELRLANVKLTISIS